MLRLINSCQNKVSADQYPLTVLLAQVSPIQLSADKLQVFKWSQAQVFLKFIWNMFCLCHYGPALLAFWFQTDLRHEIQPVKSKSREDRCFSLPSPYSRVGHALRPIFMLWLVKIWQVSSCGKFMQHLESCLLWQLALKLTEFCVNLSVFFFNCFFPLDVQNEIQLL